MEAYVAEAMTITARGESRYLADGGFRRNEMGGKIIDRVTAKRDGRQDQKQGNGKTKWETRSETG